MRGMMTNSIDRDQWLNVTSEYITFLFYNTKISDNNAESGKVPRMRFYVEWQGKSFQKGISLILSGLIPQ
jgi:hypothetical protein